MKARLIAMAAWLATSTGACVLAEPAPAPAPAPPAAPAAPVPAAPPKVPPGYTIELATPPGLVEHPMMACFDERGRLFIAETAGKNLERKKLDVELPNFIRMIEDTDNDGVFDKSTIFADKLTFPQGVLCLDGSVYCASSGAVWKFTDTDNDGVADQREKIVSSFGYTGNAADVKGPFLGPDGRLYILEGRHGHEVRDKEGKLISKGKAARIFSCKTDGSDFRSFCGGGFDNPVEIVFTDEGDMLGTVNLLYHQPRGDCLMHWVYGGVYPRTDMIEPSRGEFYFTGDLLPEVYNYGHVAVSGLCRYRSEHFGLNERVEGGGKREEGKDKSDNRAASDHSPSLGPPPSTLHPSVHLFITQFNTHKVVHTTLDRSGSTYKAAKNEDFLVSDSIDFHPTDVLEDADGSLLVIDTGGWFRIGCPVSQVEKPAIKGAIWRVRKTGGKKYEDARGSAINWKQAKAGELIDLVLDGRYAVADRAINELAIRVRDDGDRIRAVNTAATLASRIPRIAEHTDLEMRQRASWLALRCGRVLGLPTAVRRLASDPNSLVRHSLYSSLQGLREWGQVLGVQDDPDIWLDIVKTGLKSDEQVHRRVIAEFVGTLAFSQREHPISPSSFEKHRTAVLTSLMTALVHPDNDRLTEHAIIYALIEIGDADATAKGLASDNERVRRGAAIALEQMRRTLTITQDKPRTGPQIPPPAFGVKLEKEAIDKLEALAKELKKGDAASGRKIFESQKAACTACHRVGDKGAEVGLNLTKIGAIRSERDLLESILQPSASFARGFEPFQVRTKEGDIVTGVISRETADAIHLRHANNTEAIVKLADIDKIEASKLSIMPSNYAELLTKEELADLIAYLMSLK